MDTRRAAAILAGITIAAILGTLGYQMAVISGQQDDVGEFSDQQTVALCEDIREQTCLNREITQGDYPDSCFVDGEHVLDEPYSCPG